MNDIVSILIFSHPSLGYDKKQISYPVDLNAKYPMNGSGLCNQFMRVINTMHYCEPSNNRVYFDLFSNDIFSGTMARLSSVIDLESIRLKHGYNVSDITEMQPYESINGQRTAKKYYIYDDGYVFRLYNEDRKKFEEICKSLIFSEKFEAVSKAAIEMAGLIDKEINLVHLRIDSDYKTHVTGCASENFDPSTEPFSKRVAAYESLVDSYRSAIAQNCVVEKPLVLLLEDIDHPLVVELKSKYEVFTFDKKTVSEIFLEKFGEELVGREYFALVDMLIGKNLKVDNFIGLEQSFPGPDGQKHSSSFSILLKYITDNKKITMV